MKPSRENVFGVMARLEQAGALPESGVTSVFLSDQDGSLRRHPTQLAAVSYTHLTLPTICSV